MNRLRHGLMWWRLASILLFCAIVSSSCANSSPERTFTTTELLINLTSMPANWLVSRAPGKVEDHLSTDDSSMIGFSVEVDGVQHTAAERIYRYGSSAKAQKVYEEMVLPAQIGTTPQEWKYQSSIADQSRFTCYNHEQQGLRVCKWSGRYEEYVLTFHSHLVPGYMTIDDMEKVIKAIDTQMGQYLEQSPSDK